MDRVSEHESFSAFILSLVYIFIHNTIIPSIVFLTHIDLISSPLPLLAIRFQLRFCSLAVGYLPVAWLYGNKGGSYGHPIGITPASVS